MRTNAEARIRLKGGSENSFVTANDTLGSEHFEDPALQQDDTLVLFQNVNSFRKRRDEISSAVQEYGIDQIVLLECFREVDLHEFFTYRHNSNLFPSRVGRRSSGIFIGAANSPIYKVRNPVGDFIY